MTLQQLRYVTTVADTGTISRAAQQFYISQPSLTNAIRELEQEVGLTIHLFQKFLRRHRLLCCCGFLHRKKRGCAYHRSPVETFRKSRRAIFIVEALLSDLSFDVLHTSCEKPFDLLCYRIHRKCLKVNGFCTFDIKNVNIDKNARCKLVKTPLK